MLMLLGEDEWKRGEVVLKDLSSGRQETVNLDEMVDAIDRILGLDAETPET